MTHNTEIWKEKMRQEAWNHVVWLMKSSGCASDLWSNANNFFTTKLEGYAIVFLIFLTMLFSKDVPQIYQFYSFKCCAVENMYEERLDGWQIIYFHLLLFMYFCYTGCTACSRRLLWVYIQKQRLKNWMPEIL